ncbi:hypothetical protein VTN77DRAFT_8398 [Rasamsonia byssochlamydoides]|uniref:uncharacterized protein n=1 Tax=Rasamsonia byssochlamydoides TaxID=89139 RepID=UPI003743EF21
MVGVAGKSKGCHTCRKRKIRCDLGRPTCGRCTRSSRVCEGYDKPTIFLNHFPRHFEQLEIPRNSVQQTNGGNYGPRPDGSSWEPGRPADEVVRFSRDRIMPNNNELILGIPNLQKLACLVEAAQHDQALASFVTYCLPARASEEVPLSWLSSLARIPKKTRALPLAASTLCYGWIGHVENRPDIVDDGLRLYSRTLEDLQEVLRQNEPALQPEILPTMQLLVLYELFEFGTESGAGWLTHSAGIETALRLRGPEMHVEGLDLQMFQFYRTIGILKGMTSRKSTFLSEAEWVNVPWSLQPKNWFHQFLDLASEVPALLEQADALPWTAVDERSMSLESRRLLLQFADLVHRLKDWEDRSGIHLPLGPEYLAPHWGASSMVSETGRPPVRTHRYPSKYPQSLGTAFDALQSARLMLFYWATALTLYTTVYDNHLLFECLLRHADTSYYHDYVGDNCLNFADRDLDCLSKTEANDLADKISVWADFCSQNAWQSFGPAIAIFSLKTAIHWYQLSESMTSSSSSSSSSSSFLSQPQLQKCVDLLDRLTFCDLKAQEGKWNIRG